VWWSLPPLLPLLLLLLLLQAVLCPLICSTGAEVIATSL